MSLRGRCKNKFCGIFNYSREVYILYCYAFSPTQAKEIFFRRLAKLHNVSVYTVRQVFDGSKPNFEIKIECEFMETENESLGCL